MGKKTETVVSLLHCRKANPVSLIPVLTVMLVNSYSGYMNKRGINLLDMLYMKPEFVLCNYPAPPKKTQYRITFTSVVSLQKVVTTTVRIRRQLFLLVTDNANIEGFRSLPDSRTQMLGD